jgi:trimeric autotransporter adhesin
MADRTYSSGGIFYFGPYGIGGGFYGSRNSSTGYDSLGLYITSRYSADLYGAGALLQDKSPADFTASDYKTVWDAFNDLTSVSIGVTYSSQAGAAEFGVVQRSIEYGGIATVSPVGLGVAGIAVGGSYIDAEGGGQPGYSMFVGGRAGFLWGSVGTDMTSTAYLPLLWWPSGLFSWSNAESSAGVTQISWPDGSTIFGGAAIGQGLASLGTTPSPFSAPSTFHGFEIQSDVPGIGIGFPATAVSGVSLDYQSAFSQSFEGPNPFSDSGPFESYPMGLPGPWYVPGDLGGTVPYDKFEPLKVLGGFNQLETFGTDASNAWSSSAADPADPSAWNLAASFAWTPSDIAGVGFEPGTVPSSGGFVGEGARSFTPNETSNVVFSPEPGAVGDSSEYYFNGNYDVGDFSSSYDYGYTFGGDSSDSYYFNGNYDVGDFSSSYDYGYTFGGDDFGGFFPVILDVDGDGIDITPLSSSNMFFDMAGYGRQHHTAWAGAGDGVLVLDLGNDGQITQRNEVVFTDWDATATSDMQALAHVFDTNNSGSLDSGDAQFSSFKLLVTNADGTTTLKTLGQAGVTSIGLIPDATRIVLPDGSVIDGQSTFTRSGGGTGKAATVTLTSDLTGYIVNRTVTHNGDGSTTIDNKALNPDGSVAYEITGLTSADGNTRTLSFDHDGDAVVDQIQTVATVSNADGSKTETVTNKNGAAVLLNKTATTTSADGKTIGIARDATGDGLNDQTEARVTAVDGSATITISDLNPDGSLKGKATTTTSANGLTRTVQSDLDGNATSDVTEVDSTVVNADGSRTKTVTTSNNNGSLRNKATTTTSADGRTKSTQTDLNGDNVIDLTYACMIAILADGTSTSTETTSNNNGSLRSKTVTALSADGLSRTTQSDVTGDALFDATTTDVTVINADGSRTQTVSTTNRDGSLRDKTITLKGADGISRTIESDVNGDGGWDRVETIAVDGTGATVDTVTEINANGFYTSKVVTTTSANGLTVTTQSDLVGDADFDNTRTVTTTKNADGSATVTETDTSTDGTLLDKVVTTTSADGLSRTIQADTNGDGTFEVTTTDITVVNPDTSRVQTVTERFTDGTLKAKSVAIISADRKTITITEDVNGDAANDLQETIVTQMNGTVVDTVSRFNPNASLLAKTVTTTSATGLSMTTQVDENGDAVFDVTRTDVTVLGTDGSRTQTITDKNTNNSVRDQIVTTTNATGLSTTAKTDRNGDGIFDLTTTSTTVLNADGSRTTTVQDKNANASLRDQVITTTSANGLSKTRQTDLNGDGTVDRNLTDVVTLNANGSRTETVTERNAGSGSLRSQSITTTSADRRSMTVTRDTNGDGSLDETQSTIIQADGGVVGTLVHLNPNGSIRDATTTTTSFDGTTVTTDFDLDGDGDVDATTWHSVVLNANGSTDDFLYHYAGTSLTLINTTTISTSADGRFVTTWRDFDGDGWTDLATTDVLVVNADGSRVETVGNFSGDNSLRDATATTTSADGRSITISADTYGDGDVSLETLRKTIVVQADGSQVTTVTYPGTDYSSETDTRTRSANGLSSSIVIIDPNVGFDWINVSSVTTLNSDGSRTDVFTNPDIWGYDTTTTTSATGLSKTVQMSGAVNEDDPMLAMNATDVTVLNVDGSTTETITSAITQTTSNSTGGTSKTVITTSDDGLSRTVQLDVNNDARFDRTDATVVAVDGSMTETITLLNYGTGALVQKDVLTTSFDGRSQSLQRDKNGDAVFDHFETTATNTDGSVTGTTSNTNASGGLLDRLVTTTSANGLSKSSTIDVNGDGAIDYSQISTTTLNADGSRTSVLSNFFGNGSLRSRTVTSTSANGLVETTEFDLNGDGVIDEVLSDVTTFYQDGWRDQLVTETYADGTGKSGTYHAIDAASFNSYEVTNFDTNGDGFVERDIEVWVDQDGYRTEFLTYYNPDGTIKQQIESDNSPDGLSNLIWYDAPAPINAPPDENTYFIPGSNGSYLWNRFTPTIAQTATHTIDLSGVDTWVWANQTAAANATNPILKTLRIDLVTEKKLIDMARRIYDSTLDRTMGQSEVQMLADYISANGVLDTTKLANDLMATTEFKNKYGTTISNLQFVERVYQNANGRAASMAELNVLVGQLNAGTTTRAALLNLVSESAEHLVVENVHAVTNNTQSGNPTFSRDHTTDKQIAGDIIRRLYDAALDRAATASEVTTQSQKILLGTKTEAQVAADILALPEFTTKYGTLTNTAYVNQIFVNALGRAPMSSESSFWTSALNAGTVSRADFLDGIAQSSEHLAIAGASIGGSGNDTIYSRDGADTINGGAGIDVVDYSLLTMPGVVVNLATGVATQANGSSDTLTNIENVRGGSAADTITGKAGANVLTGGGGNDKFIFKAAFGADTVTDFQAGHDLIQFDVGAFSSTNAVLGACQQVGTDVLITASASNTVTLKSINLSSLSASDFRLA